MPPYVPLDVDAYLVPIPGSSPSGASLRYEDDYSDIERAREEEEDASDTGLWKRDRKKADWDAVIDLGLVALRDKTKDLEIAGWVVEALARRKGLPGLADGLRLTLAIQETFWDSAHPDSGDLELREGVYEFLDDEKRLPLIIKGQPITDVPGLPPYSYLRYKESREVENLLRKPPADGEDLEARFQQEGKIRAEEFDKAADATDRAFSAARVAQLAECLEAVSTLNRSIQAPGHYGRKGRTLGKTAAALEEVAKLAGQILARKPGPVEEPEPVEEPAEPEDEPAEGEATGWAAPSWETPESPEPPLRPSRKPAAEARPAAGPIAGPEDARSRVSAAARYLREADPGDPLPYLLVRALRMGGLYRSGHPIDPSTFPPPAVEDRQALRRLAAEGSWAEVLEQAEVVLSRPEGAGWLDARRFALKALAELGLEDAARASIAVLGAELRDYPEWTTSEHDDGTPCANAETRAWIEQTFPAAAEPVGSTPPEVYSRVDDGDGTIADEVDGDGRVEAPRDPWDHAQDLIREGRSQEAIALVGRAAREAGTGRERFFRTFQQAEFCLILGRPGVALPLLEGLARQIDELHLDRWEDPVLCARVVAALYRCLRGKDDGRARAVYERLCQLDIGHALGVNDAPEG